MEFYALELTGLGSADPQLVSAFIGLSQIKVSGLMKSH